VSENPNNPCFKETEMLQAITAIDHILHARVFSAVQRGLEAWATNISAYHPSKETREKVERKN
jgi:hypothetical protein